MPATNGRGGRSRFGALLLIAAGVAALIYGKFSYVEDTHTAELGDIRMSVQEHRTVSIPVWVGFGAILAGSLLLVLPSRKWVL